MKKKHNTFDIEAVAKAVGGVVVRPKPSTDMVIEQSLDDFRNSGLLLIANQLLHVFGWAIVVASENGKSTRMYPARVKFRGFDAKSQEKAYIDVAKYMQANSSDILHEAES